MEVDDVDRVYRRVEELGIPEREIALFSNVSELPDGSIQMFLRGPTGNLVEVVQREAATADRPAAHGLVRLAYLIAQPVRTSATLFLDAGDADQNRTDGPPRPPAEVFADHGRALLTRVPAAIAADYAEMPPCSRPAATTWPPGGARVLRRPAGPAAAGQLDRADDEGPRRVVFYEWSVNSPAGAIDDGIDTLLIRNGAIEVQTVRYSWAGKPSEAVPGAADGGDAD